MPCSQINVPPTLSHHNIHTAHYWFSFCPLLIYCLLPHFIARVEELLICAQNGRSPKWNLSRSCWPHSVPHRLQPKPSQFFLQPPATLTAFLPLQWVSFFHDQNPWGHLPGADRWTPDGTEWPLMQGEDTNTRLALSHRQAAAKALLSSPASPWSPWAPLGPRNQGKPCSSEPRGELDVAYHPQRCLQESKMYVSLEWKKMAKITSFWLFKFELILLIWKHKIA